MRPRAQLLAGCVAALLLCAAGGAARATTIPFEEVLEPGYEFVSGDGLVFSDFRFYSPCNSVDPGDLTLGILDDGIEIAGPLTVDGFGYASFFVSYRVTAPPGQPIDGASLELAEEGLLPNVFATKRVIGDPSDGADWHPWGRHGWGLLPWLWGYLDGGETLALLKTAAWESPKCFLGHWQWLCEGGEVLFDQADFEETQEAIKVIDGVRIVSWRPGDEATFSSITNRFSVVPEPGSSALLAIGLAGLALAGRRPQARRSRSSK